MFLAVNFFDSIINFFNLLWDCIQNIFSALINLFVICQTSVAVPLMLIPLVPGIIGTSITLIIGIGLTKLILGWGNS